MSDILSIISVLFLPVLISVILIYGLIHRIPIYDTFIEGAQEGLKTCVEILPFIIGIFIAIEALTTSGAMDFIENMVQPFLERIGIPEGLTSIILLRLSLIHIYPEHPCSNAHDRSARISMSPFHLF